ncbi:MAG: hypothetical protein GWP91_23385 [Rhodobacterales bacterium]|nr:hypothetical protein [Rhodobacterales bacterium]
MITPMLAGILFLSWLLIFCAIKVATTKNLVHSVFWLAGVLLLMAAVFVILGAPFLAGIQVVLYTGGVITLMLFGIMLTQRKPDTQVAMDAENRGPALATAVGMLLVLLTAIWGTPELATMTPSPQMVGASEVGKIFLSTQLLAFEVLSLLLLAAMIGTIVLVRKGDH